MHAINADTLAFNLRVLDRCLAVVKPDFVAFFEDMSYNLGPMCSEEQFKTHIAPWYRQMTQRLKELDIIPFVDSDGKIDLMVPWFADAGVDGFFPLERQAGVDIVDTALSPFGNGTAQPATEPLVATLAGTERDTGLDLVKLSEAAKFFRPIADRMLADGTISVKSLGVDTNTLLYQVPGGMLSNLISQLKEAGKSDQYYEVLAEVPRVREDFGYPPLVTPTSQIVGTQAVMNIINGERYKVFTKESKALLRGEYGTLPAPVNEEVRRKAIGDAEVITCRPADLLKPELAQYREEIKDHLRQEEDVLSYALFPQVALKFFEAREAAERKAQEPQQDDSVRTLYVEDIGA